MPHFSLPIRGPVLAKRRLRIGLLCTVVMFTLASLLSRAGGFGKIPHVDAQAGAPSPTPTAIPPVFYWQSSVRGIEWSRVPAFGAAARRGQTVLIARIDPSKMLLRVYYQPGRPRGVKQWVIQWPSAEMIVNANYYHGSGRPLGLLMIGNRIVAQPSQRPGTGLFFDKDDLVYVGPMDVDRVKASIQTGPYAEAFEGLPLLAHDGQAIISGDGYDATSRARRTIIAQDNQGRILVMATTPVEVTMPELTDWLLGAGLDIQTILNMDGGSSAQLYVPSSGNQPELAMGVAAIPVVLVAYSR